MADSRRVARIASLIKREVGQMLMQNGLKDDRVGAGMVSVTDVDVSKDLQHVQVFVSIYGTPEAQAETMAGLEASLKWVRREIGQRVRLRRTPEIFFRHDTSLERGDKIITLLNRLKESERSMADAEAAFAAGGNDTEDLAEDWAEDLDDAELADLDDASDDAGDDDE